MLGRLFDKVKKIAGRASTVIGYVLKGGPFDGAKTPLALLLLVLTKSGVFPEVDFMDGLSLDELAVIYASIDAKLKAYGIRKG